MAADSSSGGLWGYTIGWQFLNEPLWAWFVFIIVMGFALNAWNGVVSYMK